MMSMSVCLLAYLKNHMSKLHEIFCTCYLWPWFNPLMTLEYVMYFGFMDDVVFYRNRPYGTWH